MSDVPDDLKYTAEHEWVRSTEGSTTVRIGITDYAQEALGDVVYVSLPAVGDSLDAGAAVGEVESTKSVSDIFAPLNGTVRARNEALDGTPELINSDPYGEGWLLELEVSDPADLDGLLDPAAYGALAG
jgi:glycine cleavage system H protein